MKVAKMKKSQKLKSKQLSIPIKKETAAPVAVVVQQVVKLFCLF